ncbi:hypothetical protein Ahy_B06g080253 isoform D [Arachis hypogaea]|uniref:serine O-acetyltransferase n=1 Tax=Arachis hypogaea TaxID=3818 RepID=A0A444YHG5_ARAHY|nr:hypothetical protein Ahy_B06g080253 isoform D [Arachis hypogaea]
MMITMAESFIFSIAESLAAKLASRAYQEASRLVGVYDDLQELKTSLSYVKAVLLDAEQKQEHNHELREWLKQIKLIFYDAENFLDEVDCETLSKQVVRDYGTPKDKPPCRHPSSPGVAILSPSNPPISIIAFAWFLPSSPPSPSSAHLLNTSNAARSQHRASLPSNTLFDLFVGILKSDQEIMDSVKDNLKAVKERDPACINHVHCFLNFKGFLACQSHRVAHKLWLQGRKVLAVMIQNRVSEIFAVGIHPGAKIGSGILLDHVTGLVVGETAVIGNIVSILHSVTLGGTGKASGDRHPKIGDGVLIGAGTCILGNIKVGECAKIGAGSVVIKNGFSG